MAESEKDLDLQTALSSEDLAASSAIELRRAIHCRETASAQARKLLANFGSVEKKLSTESKAECRRGALHWIIGETDEAVRLLENARSSKERNVFLGLAYLDGGRTSKALDCLSEASRNDPADLAVALLYAETLVKSGETDDAEALISKVLKKDSKNPDAHYLLGRCYEHRGAREDASKCYEQAITVDPVHAPTLFRIAFETDLDGDEAKAQELYEQLASMKPRHVNTLLNLGVLYEDAGEYDKAIRCYQAICDENPNHRRARLFLADATASKIMYYDEEASRREERMSMLLSTNVNELNFSTRVREGLNKAMIASIGELSKKTEEELLAIPNFGRTSLNEVKDGLRTKGLTLYKDSESQEFLKQVSSQVSEEVMNKALADFEWSGRIRKVFEKTGINTIGDLLQHTEAEMLKQPNLGMTSIKEIRKKLATLGVAMQAE